MARSKVAVTIDEKLLVRLDELVGQGVFRSRSRAVEDAVREMVERRDGTRLAREAAKLDPVFEKKLSEEGLSGDLAAWPEY